MYAIRSYYEQSKEKNPEVKEVELPVAVNTEKANASSTAFTSSLF